MSRFRKRGLANGVSPFFSFFFENETEKMKRKKMEENGKKEKIGTRNKQPKRKKNGNDIKRKRTEQNGRKRKKMEATPFR